MQRISVQYAAVPVPTLGPGDLGIVSAACCLPARECFWCLAALVLPDFAAFFRIMTDDGALV